MEYAIFKEKMLSGLKELNLVQDNSINNQVNDQVNNQELIDILTDKLTDKIGLLYQYQNYLLEENKHYNLTAITDPEEILSKHFLDSLALLAVSRIGNNDSLIDIGTGAGFPGLVIKIFLPDLRLLLLDSQQKRINFLKELARRLGIEGIEMFHERAEDLAQDKKYREKFDWVVSRAVAPLNILSEYTLPFCRPGGKTVLYKGPAFEEELAEGKEAITLLGGEIEVIKNLKVPGLEGERNLIFIAKTRTTPPKYPRRAGIPKKRPL